MHLGGWFPVQFTRVAVVLVDMNNCEPWNLEEALWFGWVDSKPSKLDEHRTMLWFSPRKPKSAWSRPNKERVARLVEQRLMHASGLAKIKAAQLDGSWAALNEVEQLVVPPDLQAELARYPKATAHFNGFPRSAKRGILEWISQAKKPETRAKRVHKTARRAQDNVRASGTPNQRPEKSPVLHPLNLPT